MPIYRLGEKTPQIDPQSWVAPNATLIGQVVLERNASVWWNCTLRGDTDRLTVGENSNIQDNSVLHTDPGLELVVGANVTVGHMVMLHGCTIGDGSLIGINAVVLNNAVIGRECLIGANALIPEGKVYPDGVLIIGSPGKVVRELSAEEIARLPGSAERYVQNWRRYQSELQPL